MPLYEFSCQTCQYHFEELCSLSAAETMQCPSCGHRAKRRISNFAVKAGGTFRNSSGNGCGGCARGTCTNCRH